MLSSVESICSNLLTFSNGRVLIKVAARSQNEVEQRNTKQNGIHENQQFVTKSWPVTAPGSQGVFGA
jgi:hypothetical protein